MSELEQKKQSGPPSPPPPSSSPALVPTERYACMETGKANMTRISATINLFMCEVFLSFKVYVNDGHEWLPAGAIVKVCVVAIADRPLRKCQSANSGNHFHRLWIDCF